MRYAQLTPDQRADRLASRQFGLLTNEQARNAGLTQDQIDGRVTSGRWVRLAVGLYLVAGAPRSWRRDALAACLSGPSGTVVSHLTAAALQGAWRPPTLPHVLAPRGRSGRSALGRFHTGRLDPIDRCVIDGIPSTTAARTLVDVAALLDRPSLENVVDDLLCSGRTSPEASLTALERAGRRGRVGAGLLVSVLDVWVADIEPGSPAEVRFLRRLEEWGLHDAVTQYEIRDRNGALIARVDVASPSRKLAFEYDSDRWHNPRHWEHDERRRAALIAAGWRVEHASKQDLLPSATRISDLVGSMSSARTGRAEPCWSRSTA